LFIGGEIWWFFIRPSREEPPPSEEASLPDPEDALPVPEDEEPAPSGPTLAAALLAYDEVQSISLSSASVNDVLEGLEQASNKPFSENSLVRLSFTVREGATERELTREELSAALGLALPAQVAAQLESSVQVFLLPRNVFDETTCEKAGNASPGCAGPRLGIAIQTTESAALDASLRAWESTMVRDLQGLILSEVTSTAGPFLSGTYRNTTIRYRNLPLPTTTIDYALSDGIFLITTSKSSMYAALDRLL
jgi:hypothetical protein